MLFLDALDFDDSKVINNSSETNVRNVASVVSFIASSTRQASDSNLMLLMALSAHGSVLNYLRHYPFFMSILSILNQLPFNRCNSVDIRQPIALCSGLVTHPPHVRLIVCALNSPGRKRRRCLLS